MPKVSRILVPVDFSACSRAAVEYALMMAERFAARIDILHVVAMPPAYVGADVMVDISGHAPQPLADFARVRAQEEMAAFLARIPVPAGVAVSARTEFGSWEVILRIAEEGPFDLIVMGTHGRTGISHLLLGSVAEKLVRRAPCAVMTVREPFAEA